MSCSEILYHGQTAMLRVFTLRLKGEPFRWLCIHYLISSSVALWRLHVKSCQPLLKHTYSRWGQGLKKPPNRSEGVRLGSREDVSYVRDRDFLRVIWPACKTCTVPEICQSNCRSSRAVYQEISFSLIQALDNVKCEKKVFRSIIFSCSWIK